jgi:multiple sugar transport system substrate-binding protein
MSFREHDRKTYIADQAKAFAERRIGKREFLRRMAIAGVGFSAFAAGFLGSRRPGAGFQVTPSALAQDSGPDPEMMKWLADAAKPFAGTTIRYTSEATPPTIVASQLAKDEFTKATGINVEIEIVPLEQVLQKATLDVQGQLGTYDLYYLDQSWMATFAPDMEDPQAYYAAKPDLAMPNFGWDDFSKPLVDGISMFNGQMVGIPFDIPIAILMYRKDLYDKHGLKVPTTMAEYMANVKAIQEAEKGNGIYGTTGQMRSGHYSLECEWTIWLWGNGGSIFDKNDMFSGGDEEGIRGLEYLMELSKNCPPGALTWTWDGQGQSVAQGIAGQLVSWGEFFPGFDGKDSKVVGLMEAAIPPQPTRVRPPSEAGFGEIPHIGHQGGSALALSKYSKNQEAAWLFMQWATSKDVVARGCVLGGGASPVRLSAFADPRTKAAAKVGPGTTRHFPAIEYTINNMMGSEPDFPAWAEMSNNLIPVELGKYLNGQTASAKACMDAIAAGANEMAAPFRRA